MAAACSFAGAVGNRRELPVQPVTLANGRLRESWVTTAVALVGSEGDV